MKASGAPSRRPLTTVQCDYCQSPMTIPAHCIAAGEIAGLLVCTQCIEDATDARSFNLQHELEHAL